MCCLTFENDTYKALKKKVPKIGKILTIDGQKGKVIRHNVICDRITVRLEEGSEVDISIDDISR